ncbi:SsgA family sporulation/cell division regulator, partial [Streptomyces sp. NPDC058953]|uniref:SsgA family sporulation/cell division regulator n=1 Tax=Streptomyces sp. NPDC058953 TaxID=3346676 RepID=UPI0036C1235C
GGGGGGGVFPTHPPPPPDELADVAIRLRVCDEEALFQVSAAPIVAFLDRTDRLVPLGQEQAHVDSGAELDQVLRSILAEENAG